jgi:Succinylglutamate desuccinylase / Aspartoacylase family
MIMTNHPPAYPIGTPSQAWSATEIAQWRSRQVRKRSYADEVMKPVELLRYTFDVASYGEITYEHERYPLMSVRSRHWRTDRPAVLITAGVHGYETSGVRGALDFLTTYASHDIEQVNLMVVPCVSPWAYERVQRWNFHAQDPNRAFRDGSTVQEAAALIELVAPLHGRFTAHIDLHETTDSDETEFRPALAARDGIAFEPGHIPDGFYLVDDALNPQPAFQNAIIAAVSQVTHIAQADHKGEIIGSKIVLPGVIEYNMRALGLCAGISGAKFTTTTEVYPDSARITDQQCIDAQVTAINAAIQFIRA